VTSLTDSLGLGNALTGGGFQEYATALVGMKDALTEASFDYSGAAAGPTQSVNRAQSATEIDVGFRLQTPFLTRAAGADASWLYLSRGSKSAFWPVKVFLGQPLYYAAKDLRRDLTDLILKPNPGIWWNTSTRYTAPSLNQPNDAVGLQVSWPRVRAGLEYFACVNPYNNGGGFRPFAHGTYLTGFYYYGDPLGTPLGGEQVSTSARLELDCTSRLTGATTLTRGFRPFRDNLAEWQQDHPGATPAKNRITGLQQELIWKRSETTTLGLGAAWQRQGAVENMAGQGGNGFAWFADLSYRWPAP
jgi:hypothetical protein